jgi:hypothetical protein
VIPKTPRPPGFAPADTTIDLKLAATGMPTRSRSLDPAGLLAEIRATQEELGNPVDRRAGQVRGLQPACMTTAPATAATFAKTLGKTMTAGEPRATHRRLRRRYKTRVRMPSKLDPHFAAIEGSLGEQPQLNRYRSCSPAEREISR